MTENEAILLKRFSTGADAEAFAELVRRYVQLVYSTSWRVLKDDNDATDVTQETFFELTRQAGRISGSLACWLHRVATQKSIDVIRRSVHRRQREQVYARARPLEVRSWQDLSGHVDQALDALDGTSRSLLLEHFIAGKSTSQLAREHGVSQATISRRIDAGLERLRGILRRKGLLITAVALGTMLAESAAQAVSGSVMGGLGKMAMVGMTRTAAAGVTKATAVKAVLALVALVAALATAAYVRHARSARPLVGPLPAVQTDMATATGSATSLAGFASMAADEPEVSRAPISAAISEPADTEQTWSGQPGAGPFGTLSNGVALGAMVGRRTPRNPSRTLHFPEDQSVGVVYLQDEDLVIPETVHGFHPGHIYAEMENYSWARGKVHIPAGKRVTLCIRGIGVTPQRYLKAINALEPNDLYGLQFFATEPVTIADDLIAPIARLMGLRRLGLASIRISPQALRCLAQLPHVEQLNTPMGLTDEGMAEIAKMKSLRILHVARDQLTDRGLRLVGSLPNLESLDLYGNAQMTDAGLAALTNLRLLRHMRLGVQGPFTDRGMAHLAKLPALRVLWLDTHGITDTGLRELAQSRSLERLCICWLDQITDRGIGYLRDMPQLKGLNLAHLRLLTDTSLVHLAALTNLDDLHLSGGFTDTGVEQLAGLKRLERLKISLWSGSPLTDRSLATVTKLPSLRELAIEGMGITNEGAALLASLPNLESLLLTFPSLDNDTLKLLAGLPSLRELTFMSSGDVTISGLNLLNELADLESLHASDIRPDGAVLDLSNLRKLRSLSLSMWQEVDRTGKSHEVTYDTLRDSDLACLSGLTELEDLNLVGRGLTDAGLAHLARLTKLKHLQLSGGPKVTDTSLRHLARMRRLDSLMIHDCRIGEHGLTYLHPLKTLHIIRLRSSVPISDQAVFRLRTELPHLQSLTLVPWEPPTRPVRQASLLRRQRARARATLIHTPTRSRRRR
ncbi:MAG: sigma-70 family RNA polymerase sigma factor [Phycisphaerales bacterium]|nr:MAG: sigma-70 family RNA polymerase sigma factor [Phycisphaerales bacterium]